MLPPSSLIRYPSAHLFRTLKEVGCTFPIRFPGRSII